MKSTDYLEFSRNPSRLHEQVAHLKPHSWVIVDEIQKVPQLLNEVHYLYEKQKINFALTGSSARKLRRGGVNLLAGRALQCLMFPLIYSEFKNETTLDEAIEWGTLPAICTEKIYRSETLASYVETYLRQELIEEGSIRKIDPFIRFMEIAGILNAQILNFENVARDAHVSRTTVQNYFEILNETLIGFYLPSYKAQIKVKETSKPKFYFFDSGVARTSAGYLKETLNEEYRGFLFETFLINQVRAYNSYSQKDRLLAYYNISGSYDIDLIIETKKKLIKQKPELICIEIKSSSHWDSRWNKSIQDFSSQSSFVVKKKIGLYRGSKILTQEDMTILPAEIFLDQLFNDQIY